MRAIADMPRPIITTYYADKDATRVIKRTQAKYAFNAVPTCIKHMQVNEYGAVLAQVEDLRTGKLHALVHHDVVGEIHILFKRKVQEGV